MKFPHRLRALFRKEGLEQELSDELAFHLEKQIEQNIAAGMSAEEARSSALRSFGGVEQVKEECRDAWGVRFIESLLQDLRFGLRMFTKNPVFTAVVVLTLALGIGANTAMFSVVNAVLLRPLPYREPGNLVMVYENTRNSLAHPNFLDFRRENRSFNDIAAFRNDEFNFTGSGQPEHLSGEYISASLFQVLGINPLLGHGFLPQDDVQGAGGVVMLSYGLWKRRFGADPHILGRTLTLNGRSYSVVGVLPSDFRFRNQAEIYVPLGQISVVELNDRQNHGLQAVARLSPGVTLAMAQADVSSTARRLAELYPKSNAGRGATVVDMKEDLVGSVRPTLLLLLGAVGFVLLIACANVANLLLARSSARNRELALRTALGANRKRIVRQLLTENVLMAAFGGLLGLLLAFWGTRFVLATAPDSLPRSQDIGLDSYVLVFTLAVSIITGILFGLVPAFRSSYVNLEESLKEGGRGGSGGRHRTEGVFAALEVALAVVLLAGAGLMIESIRKLWKVDPGFDTRRLLTMQIALSPAVAANASNIRIAYQQLIERVKGVPGVQAAAITQLVPLTDNDNVLAVWLGGATQPLPDQTSKALFYLVTPDYLDAMRVPLLRGRFFTERDTTASPTVVVIDDTLARHVFPGRSPIGQTLNLEFIGPAEVVGVVGHVKHWGLDSDDTAYIRNELYIPLMQLPDKYMEGMLTGLSLAVRTASDPIAMIPEVRTHVAGPTVDQPIYGIRTMEQIISTSLAERRFTMLLLIFFALSALVLASVGIYGVMSYSVIRRTHEIGVRMALGAQQGNVLRLVVSKGMRLTGIGLAIGLAGAFALTRVLSSLLYGVKPTDPATFVRVTILLAAVALLACYIPARRATKVDPMVALRYE